jgi:N-acyl-D-amino-acid deacylase
LDYPPGSYADTDEIVALCSEANQFGGFYHTHVRYSLGDKFLDPYREAFEIGRRSAIPVHLTHVYQRVPVQGGHHCILELIDEEHRKGMDVTFDGQPYPYGSTLLLSFIPDWAWSGGPDTLLNLLSSSEGRKRLAEEISPPVGGFHEWWLTNFTQPHNKRWEGKTLQEVMDFTGKKLIDVVCDLLIEEDLCVSGVLVGFNAATLPIFFQHPLHIVGTDSLLLGDYVNPRTYGAYPYILGNYVREERFLPLQEAIRKMTSAPAQRFGLRDRGILRDGYKADVVIFDPNTINALATRHNPRQFPVGIDYVIVNGQIVVDHSQHTGALPGRALRRGSD